ncbi:MAG TPA: flavin reductase family protein [Streptosporangiaceae bacterium]
MALVPLMAATGHVTAALASVLLTSNLVGLAARRRWRLRILAEVAVGLFAAPVILAVGGRHALAVLLPRGVASALIGVGAIGAMLFAGGALGRLHTARVTTERPLSRLGTGALAVLLAGYGATITARSTLVFAVVAPLVVVLAAWLASSAGRSPDRRRSGRRAGVTAGDFRALMASFPSGVAIVTADGGDGKPYGMTCSSVCSVALTPPTLLVCMRKGSPTLDAVLGRDAFTVNLLHDRARSGADLFASGNPDRFDQIPWLRNDSPGGPHLIEHAHTIADCDVTGRALVGDHVVVFGKVARISRRHDDPTPLLYGLRKYTSWAWAAANASGELLRGPDPGTPLGCVGPVGYGADKTAERACDAIIAAEPTSASNATREGR